MINKQTIFLVSTLRDFIVPTLRVGMHTSPLCGEYRFNTTRYHSRRGASQAAFPRGAWERSYATQQAGGYVLSDWKMLGTLRFAQPTQLLKKNPTKHELED